MGHMNTPTSDDPAVTETTRVEFVVQFKVRDDKWREYMPFDKKVEAEAAIGRLKTGRWSDGEYRIVERETTVTEMRRVLSINATAATAAPPVAARTGEETDLRLFRCDDREGHTLRIFRSPADGDFHVSVVPDNSGRFGPSVRICSLAGGGKHHGLYMALSAIWNPAMLRDVAEDFPTAEELTPPVPVGADAGEEGADIEAVQLLVNCVSGYERNGGGAVRISTDNPSHLTAAEEYRAARAAILARFTALRSRLAEVERERDCYFADFTAAGNLVAKMHEAAMGYVCGPHRGVVEDVAALRKDYLEAVGELATLRQAPAREVTEALRVLAEDYHALCLANGLQRREKLRHLRDRLNVLTAALAGDQKEPVTESRS